MSISQLNSQISQIHTERQQYASKVNTIKGELTKANQNLTLAIQSYEQSIAAATQTLQTTKTKMDDEYRKTQAEHATQDANAKKRLQEIETKILDLKNLLVAQVQKLPAQVEQELKNASAECEKAQAAQIQILKANTSKAQAELEKIKLEAQQANLSAANAGTLKFSDIEEEMDIGFQGDWSLVLNVQDPKDKQLINKFSELNTALCDTIYQVLQWRKTPSLSKYTAGLSGVPLDSLLEAVIENDLSEEQGRTAVPVAPRCNRRMLETVYYECSSSPLFEFKMVKDVANIDQSKVLSVEVVPAGQR